VDFWGVGLLIIVLFIFWKIINGYLVCGITEDFFRKSLLSSLNKCKFKHKEFSNRIYLSSCDLVLKVSFWGGVGRIKLDKNNVPETCNKIIKTLNKEIKKKELGFNFYPFLFSLGLGILGTSVILLEITMGLLFIRHKIGF
jgi:hypothetical protein